MKVWKIDEEWKMKMNTTNLQKFIFQNSLSPAIVSRMKIIRNGSSWTNRSWCWMWLEQRSVEEHGQLRLDFTNFHELKPFLKYIKGHKLKINFTLVEKWKMSQRIYTVRSQIHGKNFPGKKKVDPKRQVESGLKVKLYMTKNGSKFDPSFWRFEIFNIWSQKKITAQRK